MEASRQPLTILVAFLLASIVPGASAAVFNEGADFSNLGATPTLLGDFAPGSHSVSGQLGASDNNDFFSFNVDGLLEAITLSGWSGAGNTFIGLYAQDFAPPGGQIGDGFFNSGNLGASPFNSSDPFSSGALAGGDYTVALTNLQGVGYTLEFTVAAAPIPLPAAWLVFLPAAGALLRRRAGR